MCRRIIQYLVKNTIGDEKLKYEVRFIKTQVLDNPIVEAKDEEEAVKLAEKLLQKYDYKDYETTEVVEVDDDG